MLWLISKRVVGSKPKTGVSLSYLSWSSHPSFRFLLASFALVSFSSAYFASWACFSNTSSSSRSSRILSCSCYGVNFIQCLGKEKNWEMCMLTITHITSYSLKQILYICALNNHFCLHQNHIPPYCWTLVQFAMCFHA